MNYREKQRHAVNGAEFQRESSGERARMTDDGWEFLEPGPKKQWKKDMWKQPALQDEYWQIRKEPKLVTWYVYPDKDRMYYGDRWNGMSTPNKYIPNGIKVVFRDDELVSIEKLEKAEINDE